MLKDILATTQTDTSKNPLVIASLLATFLMVVKMVNKVVNINGVIPDKSLVIVDPQATMLDDPTTFQINLLWTTHTNGKSMSH